MYWVKDTYLKFETSCNEYFRRICDEASECENPSGFDEGSSYLSLKHDALSEVPTKSSVEPDFNLSHGKSSVCDKVQTTDSISAHRTLAMMSTEPIFHTRGICNKDEATGVSKRYICAREESLPGEMDASLEHDATSHEVSSKSSSKDFNKIESIYDNMLRTGPASEVLSRVIFSNAKHDAATHEALSKSSTEGLSKGNESIYANLLGTGSASEDLCQAVLSNEPGYLSNRDACDRDKMESVTAEATTHATVKICNSATSTCLTNASSYLSRDYVVISPSHHMEGPSTVSGTSASKEAISFSSSCGTEHDLRIGSGRSEACLQFPETGKSLTDISDGKVHKTSCSPDAVSLNAEMETFEDVQLEDRWNDIENETAMISTHLSKNMSYKKRLSKFLSRARARKRCNPLDFTHNVVEAGPHTDMCPNLLSTRDSVEPEWELL